MDDSISIKADFVILFPLLFLMAIIKCQEMMREPSACDQHDNNKESY